MASGLLPAWEKLGFASEPKRFESTGTEILFRCYSSNPRRDHIVGGRKIGTIGSRMLGNCFFVPRFSEDVGILNDLRWPSYRKTWTWEYLEKQLNAWFWDNDYERVAAFQLARRVAYRIGRVGQDTLASAPYIDGRTGCFAPFQEHRPIPGVQPELLQVVLDVPDDALARCTNLIDSWPVPGAPHPMRDC